MSQSILAILLLLIRQILILLIQTKIELMVLLLLEFYKTLTSAMKKMVIGLQLENLLTKQLQ